MLQLSLGAEMHKLKQPRGIGQTLWPRGKRRSLSPVRNWLQITLSSHREVQDLRGKLASTIVLNLKKETSTAHTKYRLNLVRLYKNGTLHPHTFTVPSCAGALMFNHDSTHAHSHSFLARLSRLGLLTAHVCLKFRPPMECCLRFS